MAFLFGPGDYWELVFPRGLLAVAIWGLSTMVLIVVQRRVAMYFLERREMEARGLKEGKVVVEEDAVLIERDEKVEDESFSGEQGEMICRDDVLDLKKAE